MYDLNDDNVERLLQNAERRLASATYTLPPSQKPSTSAFKFSLRAMEFTGQTNQSIPTTMKKTNIKQVNCTAHKFQASSKRAKQAFEDANATAGPRWFYLPRTIQSLSLKRDFRLLQMRSGLDPKRHFKNNTLGNSLPEFSELGTIIEGPAEFHSVRKAKREQSSTITAAVLVAERLDGRLKKRYGDVQHIKQSGRRRRSNVSKARNGRSHKQRS